MLEVVALILAVLLVAGIIAYVFWGEYRAKKSAVAEMVFTSTLLERIAKPLGLARRELPAIIESSIPSVPMLIGMYRAHEIKIKPTYAESGAASIEGTGFRDMYPYRDQLISVEVMACPHRHWLVPVQPERPWHKTTFLFWEESNLKEREERLTQVIPAMTGVLSGLFDPARLPLRIAALDCAPRCLTVSAKYVYPPKLRFQGHSLKMRTDPEDLCRIIDDLIAVADVLPSAVD
jgi:hypothetical protein